MLTKDIVCVACRSYFEFSSEEQEFYESRGFQAPKKCKSCRVKAKQQRELYGQGDKSFAAPRPMFDALCYTCNSGMQLPFQPDGTRPVYCRECYKGA